MLTLHLLIHDFICKKHEVNAENTHLNGVTQEHTKTCPHLQHLSPTSVHHVCYETCMSHPMLELPVGFHTPHFPPLAITQELQPLQHPHPMQTAGRSTVSVCIFLNHSMFKTELSFLLDPCLTCNVWLSAVPRPHFSYNPCGFFHKLFFLLKAL